MLDKFKEQWRSFSEDEPGHRFQDHYHERKKTRRNPLRRIWLMGLGLLIMIGGVVLLFIPGPGILIIFIGAGMMAEESLFMARLLDGVEVRLRRLYEKTRAFWQRAATPVKVLAVLLTLAVLAAGAYASFWWFFLR
jgi:uncharacterized protein (TIGR02611 family)